MAGIEDAARHSIPSMVVAIRIVLRISISCDMLVGLWMLVSSQVIWDNVFMRQGMYFVIGWESVMDTRILYIGHRTGYIARMCKRQLKAIQLTSYA